MSIVIARTTDGRAHQIDSSDPCFRKAVSAGVLKSVGHEFHTDPSALRAARQQRIHASVNKPHPAVPPTWGKPISFVAGSPQASNNGALHTPNADENINPREAVELANRLVVRGIVDPGVGASDTNGISSGADAYPPEWLSEHGDSGEGLSAAQEAPAPMSMKPQASDVAYPPEWLPELQNSRRSSGIQWEGTD